MKWIIRHGKHPLIAKFKSGKYAGWRMMAIWVLVLTGSFANAQTTISGNIIDALTRQPLAAATIIEEGSEGRSAFSDRDGRFSISLTNAHARVVVSFVGFQPVVIMPGSKQDIEVEMQPGAIDLKDVFINTGSLQQKFSSIAKADLGIRPVKNTQELLQVVPGLLVSQHAGGGKAEQIFLRGFDCDHGTDVAVSVDGMPVNMVSHAHGQGYADAHFIIPETINRIDYGTGPYYTEQGNFNTAGYVAFSTYNNIARSRIQVEAGRFNTFRTLAMLDLLKKNKEKQSAYIAGEMNLTDGPTINKQHLSRLNLFGKYFLAISNKTRLVASASLFKSKWNASGQVPSRAVNNGTLDRFGAIDPSEGGHTERYNVTATLSHAFSDDLALVNQVFYSRNVFNLFSNFTFYLNDPVNGDGIQQAEKRNLFGYSSILTKKTAFSTLDLTSSLGTGVRLDATSNSQLAKVVKRRFLEQVKLGDIRETNGYAFVNQQATFSKFLIDAGLRLDYFHFQYFDKLQPDQMPARSKFIVSPKFNVQYTLSKQLQFFVKTGKGFHSNDARVVVVNLGREILPAAYGMDLGLTVKPTDKFIMNAAVFYVYLEQEFVYVGDEGIIEPGGKTKRTGLDLMARYQFSRGLFASINLNLTNPRTLNEPKGANYIPLAPRVTSTGGLFYKRKVGFNGGITYRYVQNRPANEDNSIVAQGFFLIDGSINYSRTKYEVGLSVENLLNSKWNEAQFATQSRLANEPSPVTELHFTPGTPLSLRLKLAVFF